MPKTLKAGTGFTLTKFVNKSEIFSKHPWIKVFLSDFFIQVWKREIIFVFSCDHEIPIWEIPVGERVLNNFTNQIFFNQSYIKKNV